MPEFLTVKTETQTNSAKMRILDAYEPQKPLAMIKFGAFKGL